MKREIVGGAEEQMEVAERVLRIYLLATTCINVYLYYTSLNLGQGGIQCVLQSPNAATSLHIIYVLFSTNIW